MNRIAALPTDGLSYEPHESKYWDRSGLEKELDRIFDLCHGCRMCFNLCPSFPALFEAVDAHHGEVRSLSSREKDRVIDLCYGCKLCYVKCPYTPDDGHEWQLDFPRLILRARALKARERGGVDLREQLLGDPDRLGKMAKLGPRLANWANNTRFQREILHRTLGIHRDKKLPEYANETFEQTLRKLGPGPIPHNPSTKVALFYTCFVNHNRPSLGTAALSVLQRNECEVRCPKQELLWNARARQWRHRICEKAG